MYVLPSIPLWLLAQVLHAGQGAQFLAEVISTSDLLLANPPWLRPSASEAHANLPTPSIVLPV
jgi:hypothetical protein